MKDRQKRLVAGLVVLLWVGAVGRGAWSLRDVTRPYDVDGFRDVGIAQSIRDGAWMRDALYKGEVAWYPPLVPTIIALTAFTRGLPVPSAYVATGIWLNTLIPVAFFLCARRLLGTWPALAATSAFLFLPGRPPAWASATYSPWPFPALVAQIPFYVGIWAWINTLERPGVMRLAVAGLLLGISFLAHSAPGVVLAGIMLLTGVASVASLWKSFSARALIMFALPFAVAFLVVAPFVLPIAMRHGMQVVNRDPATWSYDLAYPSAILSGALGRSGLIQLVVLGIGAVWALRHLNRTVQVTLASWALMGTCGLLYSVVAEQSPRLPAIVSAYHFLFVLRALKWLVFGCGFTAISEAIVRLLNRRDGARVTPTVVYASLVLLLAVAIYPRYVGREAFVEAPRLSERAVSVDDLRSYEWIRGNTNRSAVFLSSDADVLYIVGPAGRFVVCVQSFFSNPYVDHGPRAAARDGMFAALMAGDRTAFEALRQPFEVSHVLARGEQAREIGQRSGGFLTPVFTSGSLTIFAVGTAGRF